MRKLVLIAGLLASVAATPVLSFETRARAAYVYDQTTGTVLLSKNAEESLPPASMSKLMTLFMTFEALGDGRLTLDEKLPVSAHAMSYAGSTMFLDTTDRVKVEDLIRGVIVLSGNDACAVLAEALSPDGTEAGFARMMTERGRQIGLENSTFANSNGWPAAGHRMSMKDLVTLANHLMQDFPQYYPLFSQKVFEFDGRAPQNKYNRNPLLSLGIGADGLKTGHTEEAGYGLVGSAKQSDRRIVFAMSGLPSQQARAEEAERIVTWAFRQFAERHIAAPEAPLATAKVWMGNETTVDLVAAEDVKLLLPVLAGNDIPAEVIYDSPIEAPIQKGQAVAELVLRPEGLPERRLPLVASSSVDRAGFVGRVRTAAQVLLRQLGEQAEAAAN